MPAIAKGQENNQRLINWFLSENGRSRDAYAIQYRIIDTNDPETQVFPAVPGEYEDVTTSPGRVAAGVYYAHDSSTGKGWVPDTGGNKGIHRVEWRWKMNSTDDWKTDFENVEVIDEGAGAYLATYITPLDVRNAGLSDETKWPDSKLMSSISLWQQIVERACRQWFDPRVHTESLDGNDSDAIHLPIPIISIESMYINDSPTVLEEEYYKVYSSFGIKDDRRNPRIKLVNYNPQHSIYRDYGSCWDYTSRLKFRRGRQNQTVNGVFGFVEPDMSTPLPIKHALTKLVIEKLTSEYGADPSDAPPIITGPVIVEQTDGHLLRFAFAGGEIARRRPGLVGITQDQEILDIFRLYRAPIGIAVP